VTTSGGDVFVTGGSGVVGAPIVRRLVEEGRAVRALARSTQARKSVTELGAEPVMGDVLDGDALAAGMRGCEVVYHIAGMNAFCVRDPSAMYRVNVSGSRRVVQVAARAGVRRVVYTSSAATIGERTGTTGTESSAHRGWFLSSYERSKWQAEREVWAVAEEAGVEVVAVNPSSVQGPGRGSGTGRFLRMFLNGKLPVFVDTTISLVDIFDCAAGHLLAERSGAPGERYLLNGASLSALRALEIVAAMTGVDERPRLLPRTVAVLAASGMDVAARAARRGDASVCKEVVRTLVHGHVYDGSKAARHLGLVYAPVEETLSRTIAWLLEVGLVTRALPAFARR
jgi:dihydroflavonol-4-reductase